MTSVPGLDAGRATASGADGVGQRHGPAGCHSGTPRRRPARGTNLAAVPYVYAFDHKHRKPPMELKDLLGGKGANLAEMTSVLGLPVPPGFTITHRRLPRLHGRRLARRASTTRSPSRSPRPREEDGQAPRRRRRPAARQRALGRQVLDAGDDGHRPQPRASTTSPSRAWPSRPATSASPTTPTAASSRCTAASCSTSTASTSTACSTPPRSGTASPTDADVTAETLRRLCERYKDVVERETGKPFPQDPADQLRGAIEAVFQLVERRPGHRLPRPRAHQPRPRHRRERADHGVRQPRRQLRHRRRLHPQRRHRREQALRRLPRQRPGRGRRGRHPQHRGPRRPRRRSSRRSTRSCSASSTGSRRTTATCATPSSRSSRASSGCSRPGSASAPAPPPCAWPSR